MAFLPIWQEKPVDRYRDVIRQRIRNRAQWNRFELGPVRIQLTQIWHVAQDDGQNTSR